MTTADEFKAAGNAALQKGDTSTAIDCYTKAINADGSNHVYYSNRSAAYLKSGDAHNALDDANACIGLKPDFPKGYSRKGAALHSLKRYNDSIAAYNEGLEKSPSDAGLKKGRADVEREKENPMGTSAGGAGAGLAGGLFSPAMMAQMAMDPKMRSYLNDPDIMSKIQMVQKNPSLLPTILNDPKMMQMMGAMMGQEPEAAPTPASAPKKNEEKMEEKTVEKEEDWSNLSPEEQKKKETQRDARLKKEEGNNFYKNKDFEKALACYDEAIAIDSTNMTYLSNKAAVYFTQKKYDECIKECMDAVEVGKSNMAPYEDRAKAFTRCAKAYQKKGDQATAIEMCKNAQLEHYDKATQRLLKTLELDKRKNDAAAYLSDEKAEEAKQRGNDFFRAKDWPKAVAEYEEAVKRAPKNAPIRNNLSAALCKIMDFNGAKREIEKAIDLDPKYVKAWARKGDIEMVMKEFHKATESYQKGLEIDPKNATCKQGLQKVTVQINYGRQNMTEDQKKEQQAHAMADPEIQAILSDPITQQVLRDFGENPAAAQAAMNDPLIRAKINKLIASGYIGKKHLNRAIETVLNDPLPNAPRPLAFSVLRVPFFLEPGYDEDKPFIESNRERLIKKWGGKHGWEAQKKRHDLKGRGLEAGIEHFNLDRLTSNTMASHRLIQHIGKAYGLSVSEAVYDRLNQYYFVEGHSLNDRPKLAKVVAETLLTLTQNSPSEQELLDFLNGNEGREEIIQALQGLEQLGVHGIPKFIIEGTYMVDGAARSEAFVGIFREIEARGEVKGGPVFGEILGISDDIILRGSHVPRDLKNSQ